MSVLETLVRAERSAYAAAADLTNARDVLEQRSHATGENFTAAIVTLEMAASLASSAGRQLGEQMRRISTGAR